jgi:hypothetical protein
MFACAPEPSWQVRHRFDWVCGRVTRVWACAAWPEWQAAQASVESVYWPCGDSNDGAPSGDAGSGDAGRVADASVKVSAYRGPVAAAEALAAIPRYWTGDRSGPGWLPIVTDATAAPANAVPRSVTRNWNVER